MDEPADNPFVAQVIDRTRPNLEGGATPESTHNGVHVFRIRKVCVHCQRAFRGLAFLPQYDTDYARKGWCEPCLNRLEQRPADASSRSAPLVARLPTPAWLR